jgi:hypothetical protein
MKTLKLVLFSALSLLVLGLIDYSLILFLSWSIDKTVLWRQAWNIVGFVLLVPLIWGMVWGIFKIAAMGLAALLIPVAPDRKASLYLLISLTVANCAGMLVYYWSRDMQFSGKTIMLLLMISAFILDFSITTLLIFSRKEHSRIQE